MYKVYVLGVLTGSYSQLVDAELHVSRLVGSGTSEESIILIKEGN